MRILDLEILVIADRLVLSAQERDGSETHPVVSMEEIPFPAATLTTLPLDVRRCLQVQHDPQATRRRLETLGLQLFDLLLTRGIKALLRHTEATHLVLRLHSALLHIPWELLYNGEQFLCLRFAMGRTVKRVGHRPGADRDRVMAHPAQMLILCDPRGDLVHASREGLELFRSLSGNPAALRLDLLSAPITHRQVLEELRRYDVVHYAGHAVTSAGGGPSGWLLQDQPFTARDIARMFGSQSFPSLVFANACSSGEEDGTDPDALPHAFLQAGVRHYLGAVSEVPDLSSADAAHIFFRHLVSGETVGLALRSARRDLASRADLPCGTWAPYVLYGDPTERYFEAGASDRRAPPSGSAGTQQEEPLGSSAPGPETAPDRPAAPSVVIARPLWRWLGGLLLAGAVAVSGAANVLEPLDLIWETGRYMFSGEPGHFGSDLRLLSVEPGSPDHTRLNFARLLEGLNDQQVLPSVVGLDAWVSSDLRTGADERLIRALARSLPRFPVVLGLEPVGGGLASLPPPAWFSDALERDLLNQELEACRARRKESEGDFPQDMQACKEDGPLKEGIGHLIASRLLWGSVWLERPDWIFKQAGWKVPLGTTGAGEAGQFRWRHFSELMAFPGLTALSPSDRGLRPVGGALAVGYDGRGRIPVIFKGRSSWTGGPSFPALSLSELLHRWSEPRQEIGGSSDAQFWNGARIVVGIAAPEFKGNEMDLYDTPIGRMFGVEVLANVTESLVQRVTPRFFPGALLQILVSLGSAALGCVVGRGRWPRGGAVGLILALLVLSYSGLVLSLVFWPPTAAILSSLVGVGMARVGRSPAGQFTGRRRPAGVLGLIAAGFVLGPLLPAPDALYAQTAGESQTAVPTSRPADPGFGLGRSGTDLRPSVPGQTPVEARGWTVMSITPADLKAGSELKGTVGDLRVGSVLQAGSTLSCTRKDGRIILLFVSPSGAYRVHHGVWGVFEARLESNGAIRIQGGTVWSRLSRLIQEAVYGFTMDYDGRPAGFGSTEVLYGSVPGAPERGRLLVMEGLVTLGDERNLSLSAGKERVWGSFLKRVRRVNPDEFSRWIDHGSEVETALLPEGRHCLASDPLFQRSGLQTEACFGHPSDLHSALRETRQHAILEPSADHWYRLGQVYLASGVGLLAGDSYRRGLELGGSPEVLSLLFLERGTAQWWMGNLESSVEDFRQAMALDQGSGAAANNLGQALWASGKDQEARDVLAEATRRSPTDAVPWRNLGRLLLSERSPEAVPALEEAVRLQPQPDARLLRDLGRAHAVVGHTDKALGAARQSARVAGEQADVWYDLAQMYWELGLKSESIEAYDRALELDSKQR